MLLGYFNYKQTFSGTEIIGLRAGLIELFKKLLETTTSTA